MNRVIKRNQDKFDNELEITDSLYITEDGTKTGTYKFRLLKQPDSDVSVTLTSKNGKFKFNGSGSVTLTFTKDNYNTYQNTPIVAKDTADKGVVYDYIEHVTSTTDKDFAVSIDDFEIRKADSNIDSGLYEYDPQDDFNFSNESELNALRQTAIDFVFGAGNGLPTTAEDSVALHSPDSAFEPENDTGYNNLDHVDTLTFNMSHPDGQFTTEAYHLVPTTSNNKLFMIVYGHGDTYNINGLPDMFKRFSNLGYHVVTMHMVARGNNTSTVPNVTNHNDIINAEIGTVNPLKYFIEPYIRAKNYINNNFTIEENYFTGISGGGWATAWVGAIDTDWKRTFQVSGTSPREIRKFDPSQDGDYEQGMILPTSTTRRTSIKIENFYLFTAGYLDLRALAAQDREHYEMRNENDTCCHQSPYETIYTTEIQKKLSDAGVSGVFNSYGFNGPNDHTYFTDLINQIEQLI